MNPRALTTTTAPTASPSSVPAGVWCCEFELSDGGSWGWVVLPRTEATMRVLVRLHGEPMGYIRLARTDSAERETIAAAWQNFGGRITRHLRMEGISAPPDAGSLGWRPPTASARCANSVPAAGPVSVIVCTRDRSSALPACLDRLTAIRYPDVEFIVVDNAPSDDSTEWVVRSYTDTDPRFRYVREPAPGLSRARNAGLAAAQGRYVAYTDDDVSVDARWIEGLLRGFGTRPDVVCVTSLVCTASIRNGAEAYFDARTSSWSTRCERALFDLSSGQDQGPLYPFSAGIFGTGAGFAFERKRLVELGAFDEALGAGTATRGGEDLDIFVRVLLSGGAIAYEPAAVVWHHHRADDASLLRQLYGYGTGLTAYLTKLMTRRSTRNAILRRIPAGVVRIARVRRETRRRLASSVAAPAGALRREFAGYLAGPLLYARARRNAAGAGIRLAHHNGKSRP